MKKSLLPSFRFGLRVKLLLLSSFLFTIPWFGYQYVWEMEKYLRYGQEQTLVGTARALATALHERPNLFNNQASFLPSVEKGKDLYGFALKQAIQLDGLFQDWPSFSKRSHFYGIDHQLFQQEIKPLNQNEISLNFTTGIGKYDKYLYLFFKVTDNRVIYRTKNSRFITKNDHIELAYIEPNGQFNRFLLSNKKAGWVDAYRISDLATPYPVPAPQIQGQWLETPQGYNVEIRIPLSQVGDNIAFAVHDVDETNGKIVTSIGSADPRSAETLGTVLVPSPEIERIVKGMSYTRSSIWVVDQHHRVLASAGDIKKASGVWQKRTKNNNNDGFWASIEQKWLLPLYYKILTRPSNNFIDQLYDDSHLTGEHIVSALNGVAKSQWRLTQDKQAVILSAASPIFIDNKVNGAVIVEENTNGIRTLRNQALERLFSAILTIMVLGTLVFFLFASRITSRIRLLRNQAEEAIDEHGRITKSLPPSTTNDEIGDLSRSFSTAVNRLSQYNHYLENMSSRLSHELRTPIAVVRTSLENLSMQFEQITLTEPEKKASATATIVRAQTGINRLNLILTNMSEATRIEQMLHTTDKQYFSLTQVLTGCMQGYRQIYPDYTFALSIDYKENKQLLGSPEHFAQLLDKVITNAVEFSQDKKISVNLSQVKNNKVLIISNNGPLLPQQMKDRLFDSMVSVRAAHQQEQPHLGLGLYIARLICQFHQGKISAQNHANGVSIVIELFDT